MTTDPSNRRKKATPPPAKTPPESDAHFDTNSAYLSWEMARWRDQLDALGALDMPPTPEGLLAYHQRARQSLASRAAAVKARRDAVSRGVVIPFDALARAYQLNAAQEAVFLLALSQHISAPVWERLLRLGPDKGRRCLEAGFAAQLVSQDAVLTDMADLDPLSTLARSGLILLQPSTLNGLDRGQLARAVQVPHYVAAAVMGRPILDERLVGVCMLRHPTAALSDVILDLRTKQRLELFMGAFRPAAEMRRGWRLLLTGGRATGKSLIAEAVAAHLNSAIFAIHANLLIHRPDVAGLLEIAVRNAQMLGAVLLITEPERLLEQRRDLTGHLIALLSDYSGLCILEVHRADGLDDAFEALVDFSLDLPRPDSPERCALWKRLLPPHFPTHPDLDLGALGATYELAGGQIQAAIAWACQQATARQAPLQQKDLEDGARTQLRSKLGNFADSSRVRLGLDSLVLPDATLTQVQDLLNACRQRARVMNDWGFGRRLATGRGLVALFAGEAGTGKTLTSEILANELDLEMHIVSIPKIVSKWVGETEKNVREVFSQARAQNALLLFDEADSLFAKRVKVERAQDHFQNMEVNNLLQEIERFDGIVILTTNLEVNMDRAFERRILFKIEFPEPGPQERARIWRTLIPPTAPIANTIDFDALGEDYILTGGQIKNAIIRAAYACASRHQPIHDEALHVSALQQVRAAGKLARTE